eukprot:scaffold552_cov526-Prasinococcus_capsulatus_cf.AAC.1
MLLPRRAPGHKYWRGLLRVPPTTSERIAQGRISLAKCWFSTCPSGGSSALSASVNATGKLLLLLQATLRATLTPRASKASFTRSTRSYSSAGSMCTKYVCGPRALIA